MKPNVFADYFYLREIFFQVQGYPNKRLFIIRTFYSQLGQGFSMKPNFFLDIIFIFVNYSLCTGITKEGTFYYTYFLQLVGLGFFYEACFPTCFLLMPRCLLVAMGALRATFFQKSKMAIKRSLTVISKKKLGVHKNPNPTNYTK